MIPWPEVWNMRFATFILGAQWNPVDPEHHAGVYSSEFGEGLRGVLQDTNYPSGAIDDGQFAVVGLVGINHGFPVFGIFITCHCPLVVWKLDDQHARVI